MEPIQNQSCCTPFIDLRNQSNEGGKSESNLFTQVLDHKEHKRQREHINYSARIDEDPKERKRVRERARFASMSEERRNELNKKRRELYQRKKGDAKIVICNNYYGFSSLFFSVDQNTISSCIDIIDTRLHRNERDRARRVSMPPNKREEINRKRRELYQIKKEQSKLSRPNNVGDTSRSKENEDPADIADMLREKKRAYSRQWYKNMPPEKKKARQQRERLYNATVEGKEAKRASNRRRREVRANTLHPDSIAMENPMYIPSP